MKIDPARLDKRETAIRQWLTENNAAHLLEAADTLLKQLPAADIAKEFQDDLEAGLAYCAGHEDIKALDFSWYYGGDHVGEAFAYALDDCETKGRLSKTDLGPDELPGIEIDLDHGDLIDEDFASLAVFHAINTWVEHLKPRVDQAIEQGLVPGDTDTLMVELFQIWNYRKGCEAGRALQASAAAKALEPRAPFWVTLTRHERWSVPIMLINP